jgi:hypothetical protein
MWRSNTRMTAFFGSSRKVGEPARAGCNVGGDVGGDPKRIGDPLTDFDMTGGDDVWFARPQLFFSCSLCPPGQTEDKYSHREVALVFFSTFEPISLTPDSSMQKSGIPMLYKRASSEVEVPPSSGFQHFMSAQWKMFLAGSS